MNLQHITCAYQNFQKVSEYSMILTDELCDKLCAAAHEKSKQMGVDISFAVYDENGLPRVYRRYGEALVLSITLVPGIYCRCYAV